MALTDSRYWEASEWQEGISPASFDKQIVRDYLETWIGTKLIPGPNCRKISCRGLRIDI